MMELVVGEEKTAWVRESLLLHPAPFQNPAIGLHFPLLPAQALLSPGPKSGC